MELTPEQVEVRACTAHCVAEPCDICLHYEEHDLGVKEMHVAGTDAHICLECADDLGLLDQTRREELGLNYYESEECKRGGNISTSDKPEGKLVSIDWRTKNRDASHFLDWLERHKPDCFALVDDDEIFTDFHASADVLDWIYSLRCRITTDDMRDLLEGFIAVFEPQSTLEDFDHLSSAPPFLRRKRSLGGHVSLQAIVSATYSLEDTSSSKDIEPKEAQRTAPCGTTRPTSMKQRARNKR